MKQIIIFIVLSALLSGCLGTETKQNYQYQDGSNLTLFDDGTFTIHFNKNNMDFSGKYRIDGNNLLLTYPLGNTERLTKNGSTWIDKDGWRWEHGY